MINIEQITDTSICISLVRDFSSWHSHVERVVLGLFKQSQLYKVIEIFQQQAKERFSYFFKKKDFRRKLESDLTSLYNSKIITWLLIIAKTWKNRIPNYLISSTTVNSTKELRKELFLSPLKTINIIIVAAILSNVSVAMLVNKRIEPLGWFSRVCFLFIGVRGVFSDVTWQDIKQNSYFMKYIRR